MTAPAIHADVDLMLERARRESYGFLSERIVTAMARSETHRLFQVLIRFGGCRLVCAAQDVEHIIAALEASGDYVRDVSIPANPRP